MAGVNLPTIKELMGHKTLAMTLRYSHLSPKHRFDAVQLLVRSPTDTTADTKPTQEAPRKKALRKSSILRETKVSRAGFEPATLCLKGRCSAA
jgi:hypothetical protein